MSLRKASSRVASPWITRERRIDLELVQAVEGLHDELARVSRELTARAEGHLREERTQTMAALRRMRSQLRDHERWSLALEVQQDRLGAQIASLQTLPWMTEPFEIWRDPVAGEVEGFRTPLHAGEDAAYRAFEDRFRGSRERIVELQRPYGTLLQGAGPVLDCGCGRGELLEVLRDAGIEARGVDLDAGMLEVARAAGFEVQLGDAVAALGGQAGALGAVAAMQVIEHLTYEELKAFLRAARMALRPGGRLVVETVNPHMLAAMKGFWLDPTHQHPLFPEVVLELCREAGFDTGFVFHPNGAGTVQADRFTQPAYAVVADVAAS